MNTDIARRIRFVPLIALAFAITPLELPAQQSVTAGAATGAIVSATADVNHATGSVLAHCVSVNASGSGLYHHYSPLALAS